MKPLSVFSKGIALIFSAFLIFTLYLLIFVSPERPYYLKADIGVSDLKLLIIGLVISLILILVSALIFKPGRLGTGISTAKWGAILFILSFVLFAAESFFFTKVFFFSDWDPAGVLDCVYKLLHGASESVSLDYFSAHPNNLMLVFIYLNVLKIAALLNTESVLVLVVFQALLFSGAGALFFILVSEALNERAALVSWIIYAVWIGFNPYIIITYSDAMGLIFPLITLFLFGKLVRYGENPALALLLGGFAALGYSIKPQAVIAFIAVIIILLAKRLFKDVITAVILFIIMLLLINKLVLPSLNLTLDKDKAFGFSHYLMMGLNTETDGVYSNEDTELTNSIKDPKERRETNLKIAKERFDDMGIEGFYSHLMNKQLVNFNDGIFSWGIDGNFFAGTEFEGIPELEEEDLRDVFLSIVKPDGEHYGKFVKSEQLLWLLILFFSAIEGISVIFSAVKSYDLTEEAAMLSIIGLIVFELLFEAKARYLFTFLPLFLFLAFISCHKLYRIFCGFKKGSGNRI